MNAIEQAKYMVERDDYYLHSEQMVARALLDAVEGMESACKPYGPKGDMPPFMMRRILMETLAKIRGEQ